MEKYFGAVFSAIFNNVLAPNFLWAFMLVLSMSYYQSAVEGGSPTWRTVAVGSMAIVGTLSGLAYRDFIGRLKRFEEDMKEDRKLRQRQHEQNVAAIIALALAGQDQHKVNEVIRKLTQSGG